MNTEDYVNFEIAKSLKQKGFNWGCISYYEHFSSNVTLYSGMVPEWSDSYIDHNKIDGRYSRPTLQMAMKWLREVHNIIISPYALSLGYYFEIFDLTNRDITGCKPLYRVGIPYKVDVLSTYEQACEVAIKFCLEKLIVSLLLQY